MTTQEQTPAPRKFGLPNIMLILGLGILLCGEAFSGYRLYTLSLQRKQLKEDYSTVNNITFGLFSVDEWRDKISAIINGQVQDFDITPQQKRKLQVQVEKQLHSLVTKAAATINKPQTTFMGKLKKFAFNKFVNVDQIQAQVPTFARTIINKVSSPASKARLKDIAIGKITQLESETFDSTATASNAVTGYMHRKYHVAEVAGFNKALNNQLDAIRMQSYRYLYAMLGCIIIVLAVWWLLRNKIHVQGTLYATSLLFAFVLVTVGITAPIIEVDARIKSLNFMLMGQKVDFENQVLFFQSKSIMGIVETLIKQPKPDAVVVGSLILMFVVIFPVLRLIFTGVHILSRKAIAENNVVKYFAFQSGHWTMADVMVVGILMTYIGLNGILESQLSNLNIHNSFINTATVNSTSLQPGYIVFVGFVLYSVVLTTLLKRITRYQAA